MEGIFNFHFMPSFSTEFPGGCVTVLNVIRGFQSYTAPWAFSMKHRTAMVPS